MAVPLISSLGDRPLSLSLSLSLGSVFFFFFPGNGLKVK